MKKLNIYTKMVLLLGVLSLASCDNFLNLTPKSFIADAEVWGSEANADLFLNDIYDNLPDMNNTQQHLDQFADNSDYGKTWMDPARYFSSGAVNPSSNYGSPGKMWDWESAYTNIRKCNLFIEKVSASNFSDDYKTKRIAEVRFIRAYFYHNMWKAYGGLPIITKVLDQATMGDSVFVGRSTANETYDFLESELTAIIPDLPITAVNEGRITQGAALTLKGITELYQASPLRNPTNNLTRWALAAATFKKVMDLNQYSLDPDYEGMFLVGGNNNPESIFARQHGPQKTSNLMQNESLTNYADGSEKGWGNMQPTQDLVDDYTMANGLPITDPASGYDPQHPYLNREPLFYQSILYDGSTWRDFTVYTRAKGSTPNFIYNNAIDLSYGTDNTHTGYAERKRMDETLDPSNFGLLMQNYMYFRYAEVLMSYAEAENEANGPTTAAIAALDQVRARAGVPNVATTFGAVDQSQLRDIIRRERRTEFAMEDKRWWDVLRWKIADQMPDGSLGVLNRPQRVMYITENADGSLTYTKQDAPSHSRTFLPRMYYMPIPQKVLDQNPTISAQNGGEDNWVNGQNPGY